MRHVFFLALASVAGCASYKSTARDAFVHDATCPADRVTIVQATPEPAPPDIAVDPGRLAVWNEQAESKAKSQFVARGCGQEIRYSCETQYAGDGRYQTSFPVCASRNNYRASYSFAKAVVHAPPGNIGKIDRPLYIVLDPSRVRDTWKMKTAERTFDLVDFRTFVSRDLRAALLPYFSDVRVVAPGASMPSTPHVVADVNVADLSLSERFLFGYSFATIAMKWSFAMRQSESDSDTFSYDGVATSTQSYWTFEAGCAQMAEEAESELVRQWTDKGGAALFSR